MNYKNYLKEQLLSEIIRPRRDFDPNLLSPQMKLKMRIKKDMIKLRRSLEQERIDRPSGRPRYNYGDTGKPRYNPPPYTINPTDTENSLESQRQQQRERRSRLLRGEFNQSDLGTQPLKLYKKKFDLSLGFNKQNPDRTIY